MSSETTQLDPNLWHSAKPLFSPSSIIKIMRTDSFYRGDFFIAKEAVNLEASAGNNVENAFLKISLIHPFRFLNMV